MARPFTLLTALALLLAVALVPSGDAPDAVATPHVAGAPRVAALAVAQAEAEAEAERVAEAARAAEAARLAAAESAPEAIPGLRLVADTTNEVGRVVDAGQASYYGRELAGNPTASGERFDPEGLTAAHRTLPLGSRVRVVNERTGESVIVRVNDRGPFAHGRVIDISERAAREIGMLRRGTARVRVELLPARKG